MFEEAVQKYGKQLITELVDIMIISQRINNEDLRNLLIKHDVIKKSTKMITHHLSSREANGRREDGNWGSIGVVHQITVYNGRSQKVFQFSFRQSEMEKIQAILE